MFHCCSIQILLQALPVLEFDHKGHSLICLASHRGRFISYFRVNVLFARNCTDWLLINDIKVENSRIEDGIT
jgi:hypothetical protein